MMLFARIVLKILSFSSCFYDCCAFVDDDGVGWCVCVCWCCSLSYFCLFGRLNMSHDLSMRLPLGDWSSLHQYSAAFLVGTESPVPNLHSYWHVLGTPKFWALLSYRQLYWNWQFSIKPLVPKAIYSSWICIYIYTKNGIDSCIFFSLPAFFFDGWYRISISLQYYRQILSKTFNKLQNDH